MGFDWKKLLGSAAPAITKALTGNLPGAAAAAVGALSRAILGHEKGSADDVAEALAAGATPEMLEKIQAAERTFTLQLVDAAVQLEKVEADDRANARAREVQLKDRMPAVLAVMLSVAFFGTIALLVLRPVPDQNRDPFMLMLGSLGTTWAAAMAYYHGSSSGSKAKDTVLGRIARR